ncbi:hypothetical protein [Kitasatospora sp. MY 5-36]|uniref:hypothetical protein n=1 Tax=Kitasatospora sp. MY 5-36 TaxID=1678027 RepID=UPI000B2A4317|nr:hypothetical protein [Kitasatospora sp. MY 5-36]
MPRPHAGARHPRHHTPTQKEGNEMTSEPIRYTADVVATTPDGRVLLIERG